jgi:hypothetical protein
MEIIQRLTMAGWRTSPSTSSHRKLGNGLRPEHQRPGTIFFYNTATSFTRAALGAESFVGKPVNMLIGNGSFRGTIRYVSDPAGKRGTEAFVRKIFYLNREGFPRRTPFRPTPILILRGCLQEW